MQTNPWDKPKNEGQELGRSKKIGGRKGQMSFWTLTHDHLTRDRSPLKLDDARIR